MTLAMALPRESAGRDANQSAVQRRRAANQLHTTGVVSRAQKFPLRLPLAPQASRNTYPTDLHHRSYAGKIGSTRCRFERDMNHALQRKSTSPGAFAAKPVG